MTINRLFHSCVKLPEGMIKYEYIKRKLFKRSKFWCSYWSYWAFVNMCKSAPAQNLTEICGAICGEILQVVWDPPLFVWGIDWAFSSASGVALGLVAGAYLAGILQAQLEASKRTADLQASQGQIPARAGWTHAQTSRTSTFAAGMEAFLWLCPMNIPWATPRTPRSPRRG